MTNSDEKPDETEPAVIDAGEPTGEAAGESAAKRRTDWSRVLAFGVLPVVALLLAGAAGFLRYEDSSRRDAEQARTESVKAARESTVALLSYKPDSVDKDLSAARDRLTGPFLDAYTDLINTVVIPGAKEKSISAMAEVPGAASVSAKSRQAVVLLFVNQTVVVGSSAPTVTASSVRVTLDKVGDRWLISGFDPI